MFCNDGKAQEIEDYSIFAGFGGFATKLFGRGFIAHYLYCLPKFEAFWGRQHPTKMYGA